MTPNHLFLYQHLETSAALYRDKVAVSDQDTEISFGALHDWALNAAHGLLQAGVTPGGRVLLVMENAVDFAKAYWAVVYVGAIVTPISPDLKQSKLAWIIQDCTPDAIITDIALAPILRETAGSHSQVLTLGMGWDQADHAGQSVPAAHSLIDQDLGCIIYTSGSTGHPKGVMLSQQNLCTASRSVSSYLGYRADDRIFVAIPLSFDYGMHQLTMAALVGASVVIDRGFSKPLYTLDRVAKSKATVFPVVPSMIPMVQALASRFDLAGIRLISSTAAALDPKWIDQLAVLFPAAQIFSMYGLTECHRCTYLPPKDLAQRKSSVGIAIPNTRLWVVDSAGMRHSHSATGELVIRGSTVMKGYWNNPEKTAERLKPGLFPGEYVFHTGDICRLDADGYVHFVARMDDMLKVKGEKVAPKEVEDALRRHPLVTEAIVYGRPDPSYGQSICAAVTLKTGAQIAPEALRAWCIDTLEPVAVPRKIDILPAFNLTANGKIDRSYFHETLA